MRNTKAFDSGKDEFESVHNMTLQQLESLASRQQDQIRAQAQLLIAKENRLKMLRKQQDNGGSLQNGQRQHYSMNGEPGRLMALRQKIEQQEVKLRRLRMLRGQVDQTKASNAILTSDLESIRILFNEKEKELSVAVSRVDELTKQLEELRLLRRQRQEKGGREDSTHSIQLEALRRELMYRQQVTSSQASRVAHQRSLLSQKQEEMNRVDRRIAELQQRLHKRRVFNDGLAHQLSQAKRPAKIAAVEPYNVRDDLTAPDDDRRAEFLLNKGDPKYQTLPYNTKFPPMATQSVSALKPKGQGSDGKVAPIPPPKPSSASVILSTSRTYTSVYSPEDGSHENDDQRPYLPPKPILIPPRLSPAKDSVEDAVTILKSKSEDLMKFEEAKGPSVMEITSTSNSGLSELSVQPTSQEDSKNSFDVAPPTSVKISINRRIEMPPEAMFPENALPPSDLIPSASQDTNNNMSDTTDDARANFPEEFFVDEEGNLQVREDKTRSALKNPDGSSKLQRRVSFDPLALLLDAALEGEVELVKKCATQAPAAAAASNDEGITALHNAVCAGHLEIVKFLVEFGCDVNAQDSDGWTPLHCAASCNNLPMVQYLVEKGACVFATTVSDSETAAQKCEEDEDGYDSCSEYLYNVQEKLGIWNNGVVYALFNYDGSHEDELSFDDGDRIIVVRKGDDFEREWWWSRLDGREGYVPRNLFGLCPRVKTLIQGKSDVKDGNDLHRVNDVNVDTHNEQRID